MDEMTRRSILQGVTGAGLLPLFALGGSADAAEEGRRLPPEVAEELKIARESMRLASGMTEAEADCVELARDLAVNLLKLPEMTAMDKREITLALHIIQNHLLSRPTYRKFQEMYDKLSEKKK
jgi:hypothetical protein